MFKKIIASTFTFAVLASSALIVWQRQLVYDKIELYKYKPPAGVIQIVNKTTMSEKGKDIFYLNEPILHDDSSFQSACQNSEKSIVLGCYDGEIIHIHNVTEKQLAGIVEVTAAHEMLHAAYDRLSAKKIQQLKPLLQQTLDQLSDERVKTTVQLYKDKDEATFYNELHSIFGTEVETLPAELEEYYRQYFTNRSAIVQLAKNYEQVFIDYENQIDAIDKKLNDLDNQITTIKDVLSTTKDEISKQREELDYLVSQGKIAEYNSKIGNYNQKVRSYNQNLQSYRSLIDNYNQIVQQRNELSISHKEIIKSIDPSYSEWNIN